MNNYQGNDPICSSFVCGIESVRQVSDSTVEVQSWDFFQPVRGGGRRTSNELIIIIGKYLKFSSKMCQSKFSGILIYLAGDLEK